MPETTSANFITEKNKQENTPIVLYELEVDDSTTLYLAEWDVEVVYPTVGGQTYTPAPLKHEGVGSNTFGEIDVVRIHFGSADRVIVESLVANDFFQGHKVVMKWVFSAQLADASANLSNTFYIDSHDLTETEVIFTLTTKLDLYQAQIGRMMERDFCTWIYKKEGCWLYDATSSWYASTGFTLSTDDCDHTRIGPLGCKYHTNSSRFGAFPGIPARGLILL